MQCVLLTFYMQMRLTPSDLPYLTWPVSQFTQDSYLLFKLDPIQMAQKVKPGNLSLDCYKQALVPFKDTTCFCPQRFLFFLELSYQF